MDYLWTLGFDSTKIPKVPVIRCENFEDIRKWNFEFRNIKKYQQRLIFNAVMTTGKYTDTR
jgi:hypothetical protein